MTTINERIECLRVCDSAIEGKPRLSAVFSPEWRAGFRERMLSAATGEDLGYPVSYGLALLAKGGCYAADLQDRIETALDLIWDRLDDRSRSELFKRMRKGDGPAAEEELLALFGFATEFGREAICLPSTGPAERKPEFTVKLGERSFSVECKGLFDNKEQREWYRLMSEMGVGYLELCDPDADNLDCNRFQRALVKKLKRAQGGKAAVVIMTVYTSSILPAEAQAVVRQVLCKPGSVGLTAEDLPLALACVSLRSLNGVWLNVSTLSAAGLDARTGERIRAALALAFRQARNEPLLTEADWDDAR